MGLVNAHLLQRLSLMNVSAKVWRYPVWMQVVDKKRRRGAGRRHHRQLVQRGGGGACGPSRSSGLRCRAVQIENDELLKSLESKRLAPTCDKTAFRVLLKLFIMRRYIKEEDVLNLR
jgi:hypothetical protein